MSHRGLVSAGTLAVVLASVSLHIVPVAGQQRAPAAAAQAFTPPPSTYRPPRTQWGDPDLQGVWDYQSVVNMERPPALAGKAVLTNQEWTEYLKANERNQDACGVGTRANEKCTAEELSGVGAYNEFWDNRNIVRDQRTSLIEDPPDGRMPPLSPEGQKQRAAWTADQAARRTPGRSEYETFADFRSVGRCISEQTPNGPQMYNSGTAILQTPGWVLIVRERLDSRMIPLDGRPHVHSNIRLWNGDSVGHWEGNTLVVDTTNFNSKQLVGGPGSTVPPGMSFENFHLIERFVPMSANRIHYYATIEDPTTWTRPWTFMLPWEKDPSYTIYEYACNEGNISVGNALRGERLREAAANKAALPIDQLSAGLIGATEATVRARLGEPASIMQSQWQYGTVGGANVLNVTFDNGLVKIVQPNDLALADVRRR